MGEEAGPRSISQGEAQLPHTRPRPHLTLAHLYVWWYTSPKAAAVLHMYCMVVTATAVLSNYCVHTRGHTVFNEIHSCLLAHVLCVVLLYYE